MRWIAILAAILAALGARPALAWGEFGHHSTASIAWANVSPATRKAVRELLRSEQGLGTPGRIAFGASRGAGPIPSPGTTRR